jgi:hypothetical protein
MHQNGALSREVSWNHRGKFGVKMTEQNATNAEKRHGGCQCGNIRFSFSGPLGDASICHCRMCQKAFGSWGAAFVNIPASNFQWTRGTPGLFRSSSIVSRGFCRDCGTPLFMREDGDENIEIAIGTLDNPSDIPPLSRQSAVESRLPWFNTMHELPEERMKDYRTPEDLIKLKSFQHPDYET